MGRELREDGYIFGHQDEHSCEGQKWGQKVYEGMWDLEMMNGRCHPKERSIQVPRVCLESRDFRVISERHFLRVVVLVLNTWAAGSMHQRCPFSIRDVVTSERLRWDKSSQSWEPRRCRGRKRRGWQTTPGKREACYQWEQKQENVNSHKEHRNNQRTNGNRGHVDQL